MFGALTVEGRIDKDLLTVVRLLSEGMCLTFHRAFDVCSDDLETALEDVIAAGCDRLLTSGRARDVVEGSETLRRLVELARGRISVVAGCGISVQNAAEIVRLTGVSGVHAGSALTSLVGSASQSASIGAGRGFADEAMSQWQCVDAAKVRSLVNHTSAAWDATLRVDLPRVLPTDASALSVEVEVPLTRSVLLATGDGSDPQVNETLSRSSSDSESGQSPNSGADRGYIHVSESAMR